MAKLPRVYAESTLNRMYKKLNLTEEQIGLLRDYFDAMSNFYLIISLKKAFRIINKQNNNFLSEEDFLAFAEIARHEEHQYAILGKDDILKNQEKSNPMDREIVSMIFTDKNFAGYFDFCKYQDGKQYNILDKSELFKYIDNDYFEQTTQVIDMKNFLCRKLEFNKETANDMMFLIHFSITMEYDIQFIIDEFKKINKGTLLDKCYDEFVSLYYDVYNNTRLPANRGYSPNEFVKFTRPTQDILAQEYLQNIANSQNANTACNVFNTPFATPIVNTTTTINNSTNTNSNDKIGRNNPCPCGSGKKYKKCCGK